MLYVQKKKPFNILNNIFEIPAESMDSPDTADLTPLSENPDFPTLPESVAFNAQRKLYLKKFPNEIN